MVVRGDDEVGKDTKCPSLTHVHIPRTHEMWKAKTNTQSRSVTSMRMYPHMGPRKHIQINKHFKRSDMTTFIDIALYKKNRDKNGDVYCNGRRQILKDYEQSNNFIETFGIIPPGDVLCTHWCHLQHGTNIIEEGLGNHRCKTTPSWRLE